MHLIVIIVYLIIQVHNILLILLILAVGGKYQTNSKILIVLISGGFIFGVWKKNIEKDEALQKLQKEYSAK